MSVFLKGPLFKALDDVLAIIKCEKEKRSRSSLLDGENILELARLSEQQQQERERDPF